MRSGAKTVPGSGSGSVFNSGIGAVLRVAVTPVVVAVGIVGLTAIILIILKVKLNV